MAQPDSFVRYYLIQHEALECFVRNEDEHSVRYCEEISSPKHLEIIINFEELKSYKIYE